MSNDPVYPFNPFAQSIKEQALKGGEQLHPPLTPSYFAGQAEKLKQQNTEVEDLRKAVWYLARAITNRTEK